MGKRFNLDYDQLTLFAAIQSKSKRQLKESNNKHTKKVREPTMMASDEALLKLFIQQRSLNIPVSGPVVKKSGPPFCLRGY